MGLSWIQKKITKKVAKRALVFLIPALLAWIGLNLDEATQAGLIEGILAALEPFLATL